MESLCSSSRISFVIVILFSFFLELFFPYSSNGFLPFVGPHSTHAKYNSSFHHCFREFISLILFYFAVTCWCYRRLHINKWNLLIKLVRLSVVLFNVYYITKCGHNHKFHLSLKLLQNHIVINSPSFHPSLTQLQTLLYFILFSAQPQLQFLSRFVQFQKINPLFYNEITLRVIYVNHILYMWIYYANRHF